MTSIRSLAILVALLLGGLGCASRGGGTSTQSTVDGDVVTTYDDAANGVRLTYSREWEEQNLRPKGAILVLTAQSEASATQMPPTISVVAQEAKDASDLDAITQKMIDKARSQFADFKLIASEATTLGGEPARRIIYTGNKLGVSVQVMNVVALRGDRAFAFAYSADPSIFEKHRASVQGVIGSVQWVQ